MSSVLRTMHRTGFRRSASGATSVEAEYNLGHDFDGLSVFGNTAKTIVIDGKRYVVPDDVELREYASFTGSQYIVTDIKPNQNTHIKVIFRPTLLGAGTYGLVGSRDASGGTENNAFNIFAVAIREPRFDFQSTSVTPQDSLNVNEWNVIEKNGVDNYINGVQQQSNTADTFQSNTPIAIGGLNSNGSLRFGVHADIAEVQIDDHYYYSAIKNSVVGFWDAVTGKFIAPSEGTLTASAKTTRIVHTGSLDIEVPITELYGTGEKTENLLNDSNIVTSGYATNIFIGSQGIVDLGTLNYVYSTPTTDYPHGFFRMNISDKHAGINNFSCEGYSVGAAADVNLHMWGNSSTGDIHFTNYITNDPAVIKQMMSGKHLYYQRTGDVSFIPPQKHIIYTDEQLFSIGDYADAVVYSGGGTVKKVKNIGEYEFIGNESFTMHDSISGLFFFNLASHGGLAQPTVDNYGLCSHYPAVQKAVEDITVGECCFHAISETADARFAVRTNFTSIDELKADLEAQSANDTPWKIWFPLAIETSSAAIIDKYPLPDATIHVEESTLVLSSEIRVDYRSHAAS